jgi:hypothetical protein
MMPPASSVRRRSRALPWAWLTASLLVLALWMVAADRATAQAPPQASAAEIALAERYAPVVKLQDRPGDGNCEEGEPYDPIDVDAILGNDEVALRGPWDRTSIVAVGPSAERLGTGLWGYHLDFPGDPLRPGCTYADWAERVTADYPATTYARVNTEPGKPGRLALQYWFYYVFNDWNNTHEGDWEMIQIIFPADSAEEALGTTPLEVGYSQHSSAERAAWGDDKLEIEGGTHPVVYPAAGSHANFFSNDVFLMRSEAEGVGCDDAGGDTRVVNPVVATVPTASDEYRAAYPWLGYFGRWGEQQAGPFNGPTGPNEKLSWTQPITWSERFWRDDSFTVPSGGGIIGTSATDFFCTAVGGGSEALRRAKANPVPLLVALAVIAALLVWGWSRTVWTATPPLALRRRRAWGQLVRTALRMMRLHPRTFFGIGVLFLPLGVVIALVQWLLFNVTSLDLLLDEAGEQNAFVAWLALVIGLFFTFFGLTLVHAATARAAVAIAAGERVTALDAYRLVVPRWRELVLALLVAIGVQVVLQAALVLVPVAIFFLVRWSLFAVAVGVEGHPQPGPLRRSGALSRGNWWRVASVVIVITGTALVIGPAIGVLALIATGATFTFVNLIAAVVYMFAMPVAALTSTYLYFDLVERGAEAPETAPGHEPEPAGPAAAPAA